MAIRTEIIIQAVDQATRELNAVQGSLMNLSNTASKDVAPSMEQMKTSSKDAADQFSETGEKSGFLTDKLTGLVSKVGALAIAYIGMKGVRAIESLAMLGAQAEVTEQSFNRMIASVGVGAEIMDQMKAAAGGTISELALMRALNTSLIGTSAEFGQVMANAYPQLIEIARAASMANPALGDMDFMIRSLSIGLKRMSPMIIDNLGLQLKLGDANKAYAEQLGITVNEMSTQQKQMALLSETLKAGEILVAQVGTTTGSTLEKTQTYTAAMADLRAEAGRSMTSFLGYKEWLAKIAQQLTENLKTMRTGTDYIREMERAYTEFYEANEDLSGDKLIEYGQGIRLIKAEFETTNMTVDDLIRRMRELGLTFDSPIIQAAVLEQKIADLGLAFTSIDLAGFTGGPDLAGMFIDVEQASDDFIQKIIELEQAEAITGEQAAAFITKHNELKNSIGEGTMSAAGFNQALMTMMGLLPEIPGELEAITMGILGMTGAMAGFVGVAEDFRIPTVPGEFFQGLQKAHDDIITSGESVAANYLKDGIPIEQVEADLETLKEGAWSAAFEVARADTWMQKFLISSGEDTAFERTEITKQELDDRRTAEEKFLRDSEAAAKQSANTQRREFESLISNIEGLLSPSLPDDWWKSALPREDEWDEWARRAADVVNLGTDSPWFQDLVANFPSFGDALAASGGDVKLGAAQWIQAFQKFEIPGAINTQTIIDQLTNIQITEDNKRSIAESIAAQMPGVDVDIVNALFTGGAPAAELLVQGQNMGTSLSDGVTGKLEEMKPIQQFMSEFQTEFDEQETALMGLGERVGTALTMGIEKALKAPDFIGIVAGEVAPRVAEILGEGFGT